MVSKRHYIQALGALALNGKLENFFTGKIYQGNLKALCVPALNCYSCPGALGSCPVGSLQAVVSSPVKVFSSYVVGLILLFGLFLGRWFCGFLCPFGFFQDLMYKIKIPKLSLSTTIDCLLRYIKYIILLIFVIGIPLVSSLGGVSGIPAFCKYICPSGTIFASFPLLATNKSLQLNVGGLFYWKLGLALIFTLGAILISRFFCRYFCPLGAMLGVLNPFSLYQMIYNENKCIHCKKCTQVCPMSIDPRVQTNSPECIRCKECVTVCPPKCLNLRF